MKRNLLFALLLMVAGIQTAWGQRQGSVVEGKAKVSLYVEGNKAYEFDVSKLDSIVFSEVPQSQEEQEDIVVTVDANGNADGGHQFTRIDEATFLIDDIKYRYENGSLLVSGYDPVFFAGTAKIISKLIYNGRAMNVVGIGNKAFDGCSSLTSVTIPNSVTSIGYSAFSHCSSLTSVTIGSGVTTIGGAAFAYCSSLTSITIPNSVTSIGTGAFSGCSGLTSITIPESVTYICNRAFSYCDHLTSIKVETGNQTYDSRDDCNAIIETATNTLIAGCMNTIIPGSVTSIGSEAFEYCTGLTSITIPNSVTSIGSEAFWDCSSLTAITIPNSVTTIGSNAFSYCSSLTSVTIGSGVTSIGIDAFKYCSSLSDVYCLAENVPSTDSYAFYNSPISSATLHVPAGSVSAYKAASPWRNFGRIVAIE